MISVNMRPIANNDVVEREAALALSVVPAMAEYPGAQKTLLGDLEMR